MRPQAPASAAFAWCACVAMWRAQEAGVWYRATEGPHTSQCFGNARSLRGAVPSASSSRSILVLKKKRANELTELAGKCLRTDRGFAFQLDFEHGQARVYRCRAGHHPHSGRVPRRAVRRPLPLYERYVRCSPGAVPFHPSFPAQEPTRMPPRAQVSSSRTSDPQGRGTVYHFNRTRNPKAKMHKVSHPTGAVAEAGPATSNPCPALVKQ